MNGLIPPPDSLGLPSPPVLFEILSILTFTLHLSFMNFVLGGMLIVTVHEWFFSRNSTIVQANAILLRLIPVAISLAVTMGVAPLLFVQVLYGNFFYISNIMMGGYWLAIVGLVTLAFYLVYIVIPKQPARSTSTILTKCISLIITLLLLTVALLYTNNAVLTGEPDAWPAIYSGAKSVIAPDPTLFIRYLHNVTGAVAVAGLVCAMVGRYLIRYHGQPNPVASTLIKSGLTWSSIGIVAALLTGTLYALQYGDIKEFLGNGPLFVGWSVANVTAVGSFFCIIAALNVSNRPELIWSAGGLTFVTLLGMAMGRELIRIISLKPYIDILNLPVRLHNSSLMMFLFVLVIGLVVLFYLFRLVWRLPEKSNEEDLNI